MELSTPVEVINRKSGAVYGDTVYDQTIIVELESGIKLELFDSTPPVVEDEMVNKVGHLILFAQVNNITLSDEYQKSIKQSGDTTEIKGKILDTDVKNDWLPSDFIESGLTAIDFGDGVVLVDSKEISGGESDVSVVIDAFRIDVLAADFERFHR